MGWQRHADLAGNRLAAQPCLEGAACLDAMAEDIARIVHAHPSLSEVMHEAALAVGVNVPGTPTLSDSPGIFSQSSCIPGATTRKSYAMVRPEVVVTSLCSGSTAAAPSRIHSTPAGMNSASSRIRGGGPVRGQRRQRMERNEA